MHREFEFEPRKIRPSMARKKSPWRQGIEARYWRQVEIQDEFWRETFVAFIKPLGNLYKDPLPAGAFILSRYLSDPREAANTFRSEPEAFGTLLSDAVKSHAKTIYDDLLTGRQGPPLEWCAQKLGEVRAASADMALLATEYPSVYQELQKERALRNSKREKVKVQFLGKFVYVDKRVGSGKRRTYKVVLPPKKK